MGKNYILDDKARKDICCRVPRMLSENKLESADRLLLKYNSFNNSPVLLAYRISLAEKQENTDEITKLFKKSHKILSNAKKEHFCEISDFFVNLFSFYLQNGNLEKAYSIFKMGKEYDVEKQEYGMLWVNYYNKTGQIVEGLTALKDYLKGKKKQKPNEIEFLKKKYPNLASSPDFDQLFQ